MKRVNGYLITAATAMVTAFSCGSTGNNSGEIHTGTVLEISGSSLVERGADTIRLGRMREGEVVSHNVVIGNSGDVPFVITGLDLTCGCIRADYPRAPFKPGDQASMPFTFDSKGLTGWAYKTVGINTSLSQKPYLLIVIAEIDRR